MMSRHLPLIALGCGAYLAFVISSFPAATALRWFAPNTVRASNVSGTIWSGSAQLASISGFALRDLRWQIEAPPLLLARVSGNAEAGLSNGFANSRFVVSGGDIRLTDLQLSTSVSTLATVMPVSGASGALSAQLATLEIENQWPVSAAGNVRIADLVVEPLAGLGSQPMSLGSYEIVFAPGDEPGLAGAIRDLGGPLEVSAHISLSPDRAYLLEGTVRERPSASSDLVQGLNFMLGEPAADGRRALSYPGSL